MAERMREIQCELLTRSFLEQLSKEALQLVKSSVDNGETESSFLPRLYSAHNGSMVADWRGFSDIYCPRLVEKRASHRNFLKTGKCEVTGETCCFLWYGNQSS
jgi:hypothetical protein